MTARPERCGDCGRKLEAGEPFSWVERAIGPLETLRVMMIALCSACGGGKPIAPKPTAPANPFAALVRKRV